MLKNAGNSPATTTVTNRWLLESTLVALCALVPALGVRFYAANWLANHTDRAAITARASQLRLAQSQQTERALTESAPDQAPTIALHPLQPLLPSRTRDGDRAGDRVSGNRRARNTQRAPATASNEWIERKPRLAQRADGTFRVDLRDVTDLAPFARGLRGQLSPQGGFVVTSVDAQGYLATAGIMVGDRLVALNDQPTGSLDQLLSAYFRSRFANAVLLRFSRGERDYLLRAEVLR